MSDDKLILQILDWDSFHEEDDDENKVYCIRLFGKTKDQKTVYLQVDDFQPYFYFEVNKNWSNSVVSKLLENINNI